MKTEILDCVLLLMCGIFAYILCLLTNLLKFNIERPERTAG